MSIPGPVELGRSVVVAPGAAPPEPWRAAPRITVDDALLGDPAALGGAVDGLHRAWAARRPQVIELAVADGELARPEARADPPWELGADFTFLRERLHFLVWANSYDARREQPVWWWGVKAVRAAGATPGGETDVLVDGRPAWVDGGPRGPVPLPVPVVHAESVRLGRLAVVPPPGPPPGGLAPDQAEAVGHASGAARIIAPAGSGKTRTLVARLRHLTEVRRVEAELVCALAYNARAAAEMRERLTAGGVSPRTVHSLGWEILRDARGPLELLDEAAVRARLDPLVEVPRRPNVDVVGPYVEALGEIRVGLRPPGQVEAARDDVPGLGRVYARYRDMLARRGEADFDEQVFGAVVALATDPDLRRHWQGRARHVLVDEFQDVTPAYLLLIRLVASPELSVFAVGDDDQTIYGYAGADPGYLIDYEPLFPGAGSHALEVNYRSPVPVVAAADRLLGYNRRRIAKTVRPGPGAATAADALEVLQTSGPDLAVATADRVQAWRESAGADQIAVLCRVNSALLPVHAALADRSVPLRSPLGPGLLQRTVLAAALAWMRLAEEPDRMRRRDLLAAVRRPSRGLNRLAGELLAGRSVWGGDEVAAVAERLDGRQRTNWERFAADLGLVARAAEGGSSAALIDAIVSGVGLESAARALDGGRSRADRAGQSDDLVALRRAAAVHPALDGFRAWLRAVLERDDDPDGVLLTTVHRVKGMEWDYVAVYGADAGLLPHDLSTDWEEERRVFHVALTRGRRAVSVFADAAHPSPFLDELAGKAAEPAAAAPDRAPAAQPAPARLLGDLPAADPDLVRQLKEWRLATSRAKGVPAYVVLHDRTIDAIAAIRPADETALAAVPGIGPAKLDAYGDDILELCASGPAGPT